MSEQRSSMLDLVRRTCDDAQSMPDLEGVYEPDPQQVAEWQEREAEQYGGELRFVNLGPQEVRKRPESETDPEKEKALKAAEQFWQNAGGYSAGFMEAGSVYRGEERQAIEVSGIRELAESVRPVAAVTTRGALNTRGIPSQSEPVDAANYVDRGTIDWNMLLSMGPPPDTEDWF